MEELDLKELFVIFWNKKVQIILIVLIFMVIGIIYTVGFTSPKYSASTSLVLAGTENNGGTSTNTITATDVTLNSKLVSTYSELVSSKSVVRQVISNLGLNNVSEDSLKKSVSVTSVKDTEVIKITVSMESPQLAAKIANEMAKVFTSKVSEFYNINNVHVLDEAEVPTSPSNINHQKDIIISAFIGVVAAVIYVLVANMLDTTIKTSEEVEKEFKLPVLASIPLYNTEQQKMKKGGRR